MVAVAVVVLVLLLAALVPLAVVVLALLVVVLVLSLLPVLLTVVGNTVKLFARTSTYSYTATLCSCSGLPEAAHLSGPLLLPLLLLLLLLHHRHLPPLRPAHHDSNFLENDQTGFNKH
eukprot:COSAG04_NODE_987_length_8947_cov_6.409245_7_plen_118_part_00